MTYYDTILLIIFLAILTMIIIFSKIDKIDLNKNIPFLTILMLVVQTFIIVQQNRTLTTLSTTEYNKNVKDEKIKILNEINNYISIIKKDDYLINRSKKILNKLQIVKVNNINQLVFDIRNFFQIKKIHDSELSEIDTKEFYDKVYNNEISIHEILPIMNDYYKEAISKNIYTRKNINNSVMLHTYRLCDIIVNDVRVNKKISDIWLLTPKAKNEKKYIDKLKSEIEYFKKNEIKVFEFKERKYKSPKKEIDLYKMYIKTINRLNMTNWYYEEVDDDKN